MGVLACKYVATYVYVCKCVHPVDPSILVHAVTTLTMATYGYWCTMRRMWWNSSSMLCAHTSRMPHSSFDIGLDTLLFRPPPRLPPPSPLSLSPAPLLPPPSTNGPVILGITLWTIQKCSQVPARHNGETRLTGLSQWCVPAVKKKKVWIMVTYNRDKWF